MTTTMRPLLLANVLLLCVACGPKSPSPITKTDGGSPSGLDASCGVPIIGDGGIQGVLAETSIGPANCGAPPDPDGGIVSAVVQANTTLAVQLFSQLTSTNAGSNVFYSPLSVETAMAMVYQGASGLTATQLASVFDYPSSLSDSDLADGFGALACHLEANGQAPDGGQIDLANAVFGQKGDFFESRFTMTLQDSFGAPFTPVDFQTDPNTVGQEIDNWVSQQTDGMIPQLLAPGSLTPDMKLVLVDALYFNEYWDTPFDTATTGSFQVSAQQTVQVPLMTATIVGARYYGDSTVQIAELPFQNSKEAIDFILPSTGTDLTTLESSLTATQLQQWLGELASAQVLVTIPKFKVDWSANLIPALQALGLTLPFSSTQADFAGIDGSMDLFISLLQHEAVLDVKENGVTAAAATAVGFAGNAAPEWNETFSATQPFLVVIRDLPTGSILFLGQVINPSGS